MTWTMRAVAGACGASYHTFACWVHNGKVPEPASRDRNGRRVWTAAELDEVKALIAERRAAREVLRRTGVSQ